MKNINILFEDNHLLVVEKPQNMLTQSDATGDEDLLTILKEDIRERYNKPGNVYLGLVHRLDRPVGGAMVFARTSKAASRLSEQIRKGELYKSYMAVLHGMPEQASGTLVNYLAKNERTNTVRVVESIEKGKKASLDYEVKDWKDGKDGKDRKDRKDWKDGKDRLTLVGIRLNTGRPHQIRVQFASLGHPLYGDQKYGAAVNKPGMQLALWSAEVGFVHPTLRQYMSFKSPLPDVYPWNLFRLCT